MDTRERDEGRNQFMAKTSLLFGKSLSEAIIDRFGRGEGVWVLSRSSGVVGGGGKTCDGYVSFFMNAWVTRNSR